MSKRKFEEDTDIDENWRDKPIKPDTVKHSLDSDEDDEIDEKKYEILAQDDIEGQEDGAVRRDGDTQITPFNMNEEMEEGHFDTEGNYHWKKEKVVKDHWLDNVDWMGIQEKVGDSQKKEDAANSDDSETEEKPFDSIVVYKQILELMQPKETVAKAIRRLGGNKTMSASERWKKKKEGLTVEDCGDKDKVTLLTELANNLLTQTGNMDIYQETYEKIAHHIEETEKKKKSVNINSTDGDLDMYADDFDEKEKARLDCFKTPQSQPSSSNSNQANDEPELFWEYKEEKNSSEIKGPFTSMQMQKIITNGKLKTEVWARKVGSSSDFYSSKRIDFELYL